MDRLEAVDRERLVRTFLELVAIDSPSGHEAEIGDDVASDIDAAFAVGVRSVLVRTGKFSLAALERSEHKPELLLDSIADLPESLAAL